MRLIDGDELKTAFPCGETVRTECIRATIDHMPTVDAIPIDKLCEWLTEIDMPLADACPLIDKYYHVCTQCDFFQRPIKECWKEILSKLMEEQNETDRRK